MKLRSAQRRVRTGIIVGALALGLGNPAAEAASQNGKWEPEEMVFHYNSRAYGLGSGSDFNSNRSNLQGYRFLSSGNGRGQYVKNNSAAVGNTDLFLPAYVYFNSSYAGSKDYAAPGRITDLSNTKNENASFKWIS